jgi:hypothetical protein
MTLKHTNVRLVSFFKMKNYAYEITMGSLTVPVFQVSNQLTDLHGVWYERYATAVHTNRAIFFFIELVIT